MTNISQVRFSQDPATAQQLRRHGSPFEGKRNGGAGETRKPFLSPCTGRPNGDCLPSSRLDSPLFHSTAGCQGVCCTPARSGPLRARAPPSSGRLEVDGRITESYPLEAAKSAPCCGGMSGAPEVSQGRYQPRWAIWFWGEQGACRMRCCRVAIGSRCQGIGWTGHGCLFTDPGTLHKRLQ